MFLFPGWDVEQEHSDEKRHVVHVPTYFFSQLISPTWIFPCNVNNIRKITLPKKLYLLGCEVSKPPGEHHEWQGFHQVSLTRCSKGAFCFPSAVSKRSTGSSPWSLLQRSVDPLGSMGRGCLFTYMKTMDIN